MEWHDCPHCRYRHPWQPGERSCPNVLLGDPIERARDPIQRARMLAGRAPMAGGHSGGQPRLVDNLVDILVDTSAEHKPIVKDAHWRERKRIQRAKAGHG